MLVPGIGLGHLLPHQAQSRLWGNIREDRGIPDDGSGQRDARKRRGGPRSPQHDPGLRGPKGADGGGALSEKRQRRRSESGARHVRSAKRAGGLLAAAMEEACRDDVEGTLYRCIVRGRGGEANSSRHTGVRVVTSKTRRGHVVRSVTRARGRVLGTEAATSQGEFTFTTVRSAIWQDPPHG